jgi:hypothetical protein
VRGVTEGEPEHAVLEAVDAGELGEVLGMSLVELPDSCAAWTLMVIGASEATGKVRSWGFVLRM